MIKIVLSLRKRTHQGGYSKLIRREINHLPRGGAGIGKPSRIGARRVEGFTLTAELIPRVAVATPTIITAACSDLCNGDVNCGNGFGCKVLSAAILIDGVTQSYLSPRVATTYNSIV